MKIRVYIAAAILGAGCLQGMAADSDNLVKNGDFAQGEIGKVPEKWFYSAHKNVKCTVQLVEGGVTKQTGKVLKITNASKRAPGVYGDLTQGLKLVPDKKYKLSFWARGENVHFLIFTMGKRWKIRFVLNNISKDWKEYNYTFTAQKEDFEKNGKYILRITSDDTTDEAFLDDITVKEIQ